MKNLKKRIQAGEIVHGCWLNLGNPLTAEIVGTAGFDWVMIDLEHGAGSERDLLQQLQALEHSNTAALVRVESTSRQRILRVLDMGVEGVMCPQIANLSDAKEAIEGILYPPIGKRGVAKMIRATGFGENATEYYEQAQNNILGILQVETASILDQLDEIAALEGVDVLFIGPGDLSMSLGIFGAFDHPKFIDAVERTIAAASKAGKAVGILLFDPNDYAKYHDMGIRVIAGGSDATFVKQSAKTMATRLDQFRTQLL